MCERLIDTKNLKELTASSLDIKKNLEMFFKPVPHSHADFAGIDGTGQEVAVFYSDNSVAKALYYKSLSEKNPRLICMSENFSNQDYLVAGKNGIELVRYKCFGDYLSIDGLSDALRVESKHQYRIPSTVFKIGYVDIQNDTHYVVFPDKTRGEITELPAAVYLAEGQFVLVDEFYRFRHAFQNRISPEESVYNIHSFAVFSTKSDEPRIEKGDGVFITLNNVPSSVQLRDKNIVSVDSKNNFLRYYRNVKHNADSFMPSVKAKGHRMAFVVKKLSEGLVLREVETGSEFFATVEAEEGQIICLDGDKVVTTFSSMKFYTYSSYYDRFEYGTVEIKEGLVFLRKLTGEKIIVKDAPEMLENGQVIYVDENDNFCGIEDSADEDILKRKPSNIRAFTRREKIQITKQVLILGNNTYANAYKLSMLKFGYKAEVLEGFEPWSKINTALKDMDAVVVVTSHISHDNMWRIKKEVLDIPVIYSSFDGANRILEQLLAMEQETQDEKVAT